MPLAWFICPYKRRDSAGRPGRYCAANDFTAQIRADGGDWDETEILGDSALVKVRATAATLTAINAAAGVARIPAHTELSDTLGDLTANQRQAILDKLNALGYSNAQINAALPADWQSVTLGQVLRFAARRRLRPRYDQQTDTLVCDGPEQPVKPVESVAARVV